MIDWLWFLNSHKSTVYRNLHGDKDTFLVAFSLAGKPNEFQQVKHNPREGLNNYKTERGVYQHFGMIQYAPDGRPAFHHRTGTNKLWPDCANFQDIKQCHVLFVTVPLSHKQAEHMIQWLRYEPQFVDAEAYKTKCNHSVAHDSNHPDLPPACDLGVGRDQVPVPVLPITSHQALQDVLQYEYQYFQEVKRLIEQS
eukprot:jgi/Chrzof1/12730/Cz07g05150.t1